jgi:hypothetical protein
MCLESLLKYSNNDKNNNNPTSFMGFLVLDTLESFPTDTKKLYVLVLVLGQK